MMRCLKDDRAYDVLVKSGAVEELAKDIAANAPLRLSSVSAVVVITDEHVWKWHGRRLLQSFEAHGLKPLLRILAPGEQTKSREQKAAIEDWMLSNKCLRGTLVVAFGGGVIGDLAGYVAATYMRGVPYVQVPTTLLGMVDSSIGGKTAVDTPAGKNLIGAFYQPRKVYIDPSLLRTLPLREICNGMAELIKAGAIDNAALFDLCESRADDVLGKETEVAAYVDTDGLVFPLGTSEPAEPHTAATVKVRTFDEELVTTIVAAAAYVKVRVVTADEREGGLRAILNYGHTVAHGIEAVLQPTLLHGECVAIGMVKEAEIARALGHCDSALVNRIKRVCKSYLLPVKVPAHLADAEGLKLVFEHMAVDKKNTKVAASADGARSGSLACVILSGIGSVLAPPYAHAVPAELVWRVLSEAVTVIPRPKPGVQLSEPVHIRVPGSKSISNRALLLAGLAAGTTRIKGLLASDDTQVMLACLSSIGAEVRYEKAANGTDLVVVTGTGGKFALPPLLPEGPTQRKTLFVQNAGTASRFLTSVLCLLPYSGADEVVLMGNARMHERPIGPLVDALRKQGTLVEYAGKEGCLPLRFKGGLGTQPAASAEQPHRVVRLQAKLSSQYVSSILMAAPYFPALDGASAAGGFVEVQLEEEHPTSLPYITMTLATMRDFGVDVQQLADNRYLVPRVPYRSSNADAAGIGEYEVEADASSASYPAAIAAVTGRTIVLEGVGSSSIQGDAGFPALLTKMGCTVTQTVRSTQVSGPPPEVGLVGCDVNMEDQTDCFMTLAAVAAVAAGVTRITGVANQRVKECNRIAAMVSEFTKCGVVSRELEDGIEIEGTGLLGPPGCDKRAPPTPATIHCYDDHRIAMSFGVLGSAVSGIMLDDAACVEKTYPEFWDDMERKLGYPVLGAKGPLHGAGATSASTAGASADVAASPRSILLIGMRGSGKSTLAAAAASALGPSWSAVDMDRELEQAYSAARGGAPATVSGIVEREGWDAFRSLELKCLQEVLAAHSTERVIACGGGIVETDAARRALVSYAQAGGLVVEVKRDIADVAADLEAMSMDSGRPPYAGGVTVADVYERRKSHYRACSTHTFNIVAGDRDVAGTCARFGGWLQRMSRSVALTRDQHRQKWHVHAADNTAFVCLTLPDLRQLGGQHIPQGLQLPSAPVLQEMGKALHAITVSADAIELRVDLLASSDEDFVRFQLSLLDRALRLGSQLALGSTVDMPRSLPAATPKPIIFTVRSIAEGGRFAGSADAYAELVQCGIRAGCEVIDVEAGRALLPVATVSGLARAAVKAGASVLASAHWPTSAVPAAAIIRSAVSACIRHCDAHIVKLVAKVDTPAQCARFLADVADAQSAAEADSGASLAPAFITLAMGEVGKTSRVFNSTLTPVTHPLLPIAAAPGQLSSTAIRRLRHELGLHTPLAYFLFGKPVGQSLSPCLQNAGFEALGIQHRYGIVETDDAAAVKQVLLGAGTGATIPPYEGQAQPEAWARATFPVLVGGGNVTMPLKADCLALCDSLSAPARQMAAVNVVLVERVGAQTVIRGDNTDWLGIVWPMQRCLQQRRAQVGPRASRRCILVVGAGGTSHAAAYAARELGYDVIVYNRTVEKAQALAAEYGGSCLPSLEGAELSADSIDLAGIICTLPPSVAWTAPDALLREHKPVVLDVAYRPRTTPLLAQARAAACQCIEGIEMLIGQGLAAFALWTGRAADSSFMRAGPPPGVPAEEMTAAAYRQLESRPGL